MTFGENLQRLRAQAGLSQAGLAEKSGISVNTIQNWEIDRHRPRMDVLVTLAVALGVELQELVAFKETKPAPAAKAKDTKKGK